MEYQVYKLAFQSSVHFGRQSLEQGESTFLADTLFSALFREAAAIGESTAECLYQAVSNGRILLSDAMPYIGEEYYLPKPIKRIVSPRMQGDSQAKKAFKKLKYIATEELEDYLAGSYEIAAHKSLDDCLGRYEVRTVASVRGKTETEPYRIGCYTFRENAGLYVIVGYESPEERELAEPLLEALSYEGIGGKRASGMGRFELRYGKLPESIRSRLGREGKCYMTLSVSLPADEELDEVLRDAQYALIRRGGFVASPSYAPEQTRKNDAYLFRAGACVSKPYRGQILDVSSPQGRHPVYRYAKALLMEISE